MTNPNLLVTLRNKSLDILTGARNSDALNLSTTQEDVRQVEELASSLRIALQNLLSASMDGQGQVDYAALKASPAYAAFHEKTISLRTFDPSSLPTHEAKLAFWINLYNTLILDGVIALEIKQTVTERLAGIGFFHKAAYIVGGRRVSCDDIEHGILRSNCGHPYFHLPQFRSNDPRLAWVIDPQERRIHFALNCASRSCPPIRAYTAEKLEAQLAMATHNFITTDLEILSGAKAIRVSSIFKWFSEDFGGKSGVIDFILAQLEDGESKKWLADNRGRVKLVFKPYDWGLNSKT